MPPPHCTHMHDGQCTHVNAHAAILPRARMHTYMLTFRYDGYRLTTMGYDFLAIRALTARGHIAGVGRQIGVGKESDIFEVCVCVCVCVNNVGAKMVWGNEPDVFEVCACTCVCVCVCVWWGE